MTLKSYVAPTGAAIIGTVERVLGCATIAGIDPATGEPEYDGNGTTMYWDCSETQKRDGKILFQDEAGDEWTFDQLIPADEYVDEDLGD